jgi:hypothetical protein
VLAAGDVATAAAWNVITNDILQFAPFVQGVFTNEAARDAAITSPTEGMHAYLTAPTAPAATGVVTYLPTGIQTIYNGAAWVCDTPISAFTVNVGTTTSTSYTTSLSGSPGTNPSVTISTGTTALITTAAEVFNTGTQYEYLVISVSGATTIAANDDNGQVVGGVTSTIASVGATFAISGLTAGINTFTLNYRTDGGTATFRKRRLTVKGIA